MTPRSGIPIHLGGDATLGGNDSRAAPTFATKTWARLFSARYDQQIERGFAIEPGTPLAAHYARLTTRNERTDLATALTLLLRDAGRLPSDGAPTTRVPVRVDVVRQAADTVEDVIAKLLGPLPVRARGMARLRILLGDGRGPIYRPGRGTFAAAMRGVLAAM